MGRILVSHLINGPKMHYFIYHIYCFPQNMMLQIPRFLHPKIFLFHQWINWSNNSPIHPSIHPSIHPFIHPSIHSSKPNQSIHLSAPKYPTNVFVFLFIHAINHSSVSLIYTSIYPVYLFIYLSITFYSYHVYTLVSINLSIHSTICSSIQTHIQFIHQFINHSSHHSEIHIQFIHIAIHPSYSSILPSIFSVCLSNYPSI